MPADSLLAQHLDAGELPCARIYIRRDRRVLTTECPVGERARHHRRLGVALAVAATTAVLGAAAVEATLRPILGADPDTEGVENDKHLEHS